VDQRVGEPVEVAAHGLQPLVVAGRRAALDGTQVVTIRTSGSASMPSMNAGKCCWAASP
jgi:hypothetical protein